MLLTDSNKSLKKVVTFSHTRCTLVGVFIELVVLCFRPQAECTVPGYHRTVWCTGNAHSGGGTPSG